MPNWCVCIGRTLPFAKSSCDALQGDEIKTHMRVIPSDARPAPIINAYVDLNLQTLRSAGLISGQRHSTQPPQAQPSQLAPSLSQMPSRDAPQGGPREPLAQVRVPTRVLQALPSQGSSGFNGVPAAEANGGGVHSENALNGARPPHHSQQRVDSLPEAGSGAQSPTSTSSSVDAHNVSACGSIIWTF